MPLLEGIGRGVSRRILPYSGSAPRSREMPELDSVAVNELWSSLSCGVMQRYL